MDLSDPHFRKTFTHNLHSEEPSTPITTNNSHVPSKRGRFEHYKYRRLLLNN